ncbi:hypothetical protein [Leifsonia shinshuensis]|uniref:DUF3558 domain-containing protein n=1 Tax=Leifsonia shinshuensis TaxID=150026 RepID=A0A7G6YFM8_9MICO|nr:hypothetical protein [Leifsonia shinshuensis]QNE37293.1 hypothetical protein F1C12_20675 [Leifsonia shinshuensis]
MTARRWSGAVAMTAALSAALLCLSGCQVLGLPGAGPTTPRVTSEPAVDVAPPLDCAAFTATPAVEALLGGSAPLATTPADALATPAARGPFGAQAAGGGWCRWGDDPAGSAGAPATATPAAVHLLSVQVLPHASASWQRLAQQYPDSAANGAHYDGGESRGGDCAHPASGAGSSCHTNVLIGGSWLAVDAVSGSSVIDEKAFHALVQSFVPTVAAIDARAATPAPAKALSCADPAWLKAVAGVYGPPSVATLDTAQSFGVQSALLDVPGAAVCAYRAGGNTDSSLIGTVSVLRGAAAAYATYHALVVGRDPDASGSTLQVGSSELPALIRHTDASGSTPAETVVDALAGDAWIQFSAVSGSDDQASSVVEWVAGRL